MSASTRKKSASPPRRSIVSGEVASSRERPGSGAAATFVIGRSAHLGLLRLRGLAPFNAALASHRGGRRLGHNPRQNGRRRRRDRRRSCSGGAGGGAGGGVPSWPRLVRLAPRARRRLGPRRGRRGWGRLGSSVLRERRAGGNRARAAHGDEYRCLPQQRSTRARHVAFPLSPTTLDPKPSERQVNGLAPGFWGDTARLRFYQTI